MEVEEFEEEDKRLLLGTQPPVEQLPLRAARGAVGRKGPGPPPPPPLHGGQDLPRSPHHQRDAEGHERGWEAGRGERGDLVEDHCARGDAL